MDAMDWMEIVKPVAAGLLLLASIGIATLFERMQA